MLLNLYLLSQFDSVPLLLRVFCVASGEVGSRSVALRARNHPAVSYFFLALTSAPCIYLTLGTPAHLPSLIFPVSLNFITVLVHDSLNLELKIGNF